MYIAFCILLITGFVFLSFLHLRKKSRLLTVVEGILCGLGAFTLFLMFSIISIALREQSADLAAWARDTVSAYLQYAMPALGIFFALTFFCALSPLWEKKYRAPLWVRIRTLCSLACSVVLLALAGFFGALSASEVLPLEGYIKAIGAGSALLLRGMYLAEALWQKKVM